MIAEPDVALTDYALVVKTFLFTFWIYRTGPLSSKPLQRWFLLLFASIGMAALVGGTVHGFLTDTRSPAARICWLITMILLGITALSEYGIAARLLLSPRSANSPKYRGRSLAQKMCFRMTSCGNQGQPESLSEMDFVEQRIKQLTNNHMSLSYRFLIRESLSPTDS